MWDYIQAHDTDVRDKPHGWIQWKGTDVCIDLHCACGHHGHYDGGFLYFYRCPACSARYALGMNVALIPLPDDLADDANFVTDTIEDAP